MMTRLTRLTHLTRAPALLAFALTALSTIGGAAQARPTPPPVAAVDGLPRALTGSLELTNERARPVEVYIDGAFALEIPALTTRTIGAVPNGLRLVSYAGAERGRWQTDRVEVRVDRKSSLRIAPLRGFAVIMNASRTLMRINFGDLELGLVRPGEQVQTPALPAGRYVLTATPTASRRMAPQVEEVFVQAGDTVSIEIRPMTADLHVRNPFPFRVNLLVDGRRVERLEGFGTVTLHDLAPGRVSLEMTHRHQRVAHDRLDLVAGADVRWSPVDNRYGELELYNPTRTPVRIAINGLTAVRLAPGETRLVRELPANTVRIQVTLEDGRVVAHETRLAPGARERFSVPLAWVADVSHPVRPSPTVSYR
jgi:hypothetical protein